VATEPKITRFDETEYLKGANNDIVIPPGTIFAWPEASINKAELYKVLADEDFPSPSAAVAIDVAKFVYDETRRITTIVAGQMQSGKTAFMAALAFVVSKYSPTSDIIVIPTSSNKNLAYQTKSRLKRPNLYVLRGSIGSTKDKAKRLAQKLEALEGAPLERKRLLETYLAKRERDGIESMPIINPYVDTILMVDECHYATANTGVVDFLFETFGIDLSKPPAEWSNKRLKVVLVSAVPCASTAALADKEHVRTVVLLPENDYTGLENFKERGKIHQSWPLTRSRGFPELVSVILEIEEKRNLDNHPPGFYNIRTPIKSRGYAGNMLASLLRAQGYKVKEGCVTQSEAKDYDFGIAWCDQETLKDEDTKDFFNTPDATSSALGSPWFAKAPPVPHIVLFKNMGGMGDTWSGDTIALVFDTASKSTKDDTAVNGFAGRVCGYKDINKGPEIYTNVKSVDAYIDWVKSGFDKSEILPKATRTKTEKKRRHKKVDQFEVQLSSHTGWTPRRVRTRKKLKTFTTRELPEGFNWVHLWNNGPTRVSLERQLQKSKVGDYGGTSIGAWMKRGKEKGTVGFVTQSGPEELTVHVFSIEDCEEEAISTGRNSTYGT